MHSIWIRPLLLVAVATVLAGCATSKEELMPHLTKVLDATDTIVTDTQASLAHLHSATESGDAIASGGAPALLALLNASAGAAQHTEHLLRHPTLKVTLGDDG